MPACFLCGIFYSGRGGGAGFCSNCHAAHEEVRRRNPRPAVPQAGRTAQSYVAARTFAMNEIHVALTTIVRAGERVVFDGTWVTFPGQEPVEMPQIRRAIMAGWLVGEVTAQVLVDDKPVGESFKIPKPTKVERVKPTRYTILSTGGLDDLGDE